MIKKINMLEKKYFYGLFFFLLVFFAEAQKTNRIIHVVKVKETLYSLSKKYKVSIEDIKKWNPQVEKLGLQIGMKLLVRQGNEKVRKAVFQKDKPSISDENYFEYIVVQGDTFYNLNKRYAIDKEHLEKLNPHLKEKGLQVGMLIKIAKDPLQDIVLNQPVNKFQDNFHKPLKPFLLEPEISHRTIDELFPIFRDTIPYITQMKAALFLPLKLTKNNTLSHDKLFGNSNNLVSLTTDFYMGAQMAVDSLYTQGLFIDLKVYDTENDKDTLQNLLQDKELRFLDFVVGPLYSDLVPLVANHFEDIPVVYPFFSPRQHLFTQDNLVKATVDKKLYEKILLSYIVSKHTSQNIVLVGGNSVRDSLKIEFLQRNITEKINQKDTIKKDSLPNFVRCIKSKEGYIDKEKFLKAVDTLRENWVLLTGEDTVITSAIINKLKTLPNDAPVRLFSFRKSKNFDKIDNHTLSDMVFTYATSEILSFQDTLPRVKSFYEKYYKKNSFYPTIYALKGFDIVYDFALRMVYSKQSVTQQDFYNPHIPVNIQNIITSNPLQTILKNQKRSQRIGNTFLYRRDTITNTIGNSMLYLVRYQKDLSLKILDITDGIKRVNE